MVLLFVDFLFIVTPIVGICNCSVFCCTLLYVHSSIAIILMGKRELVALLNLSSWCLEMVERLFLAVPRGCLRFVIVVFPDHTHLLFLLILLKEPPIENALFTLHVTTETHFFSLEKPKKYHTWSCQNVCDAPTF